MAGKPAMRAARSAASLPRRLDASCFFAPPPEN